MATATAILASIPASYRCNRRRVGWAEQQLRNLEQHSQDFMVKQLAYGVLYADITYRTTGTVSMAIRRATPWQAAQLIAAMRKDEVDRISDVPTWLNSKAMNVLS